MTLAEVSGTVPYHVLWFEGAKLLAASMSAVEWYKSCAHTSFLSEVIFIQCEQGIAIFHMRFFSLLQKSVF